MAFPVKALYRGEFSEIMFNQGAWITLFLLLVPALIQAWGDYQVITLDSDGIKQRIFEQIRSKHKRFSRDDIKGYKIEFGSLVIVSKSAPYPKFPTSLFTNLSGVIIIPPLFAKDYEKIKCHLKELGVGRAL